MNEMNEMCELVNFEILNDVDSTDDYEPAPDIRKKYIHFFGLWNMKN